MPRPPLSSIVRGGWEMHSGASSGLGCPSPTPRRLERAGAAPSPSRPQDSGSAELLGRGPQGRGAWPRLSAAGRSIVVELLRRGASQPQRHPGVPEGGVPHGRRADYNPVGGKAAGIGTSWPDGVPRGTAREAVPAPVAPLPPPIMRPSSNGSEGSSPSPQKKEPIACIMKHMCDTRQKAVRGFPMSVVPEECPHSCPYPP
mmetsp:Transcript_10065/g.24008  ORF Transcript_10065/g.24008 Transcript_10065/m.24008 type:complete len:201 (-) Transcript_10065:51-653(-)